MSEARKRRKKVQKHIGNVQKTLKNKKYKCLYPECSNLAINSHSQQKERQLRSISSEDSIVYGLDRNTYKSFNLSVENNPLKFTEIPIKLASAFPGYCNDHDRNLFKKVERESLRIGNHKQATILFLRAISYEFSQKRRSFEFMSLLLEEAREVLGGDIIRSFEIMKAGTNKFLTSDFPKYFTTLLDVLRKQGYSTITVCWKEYKKNIGISSCGVCSPIMDLNERHKDRAHNDVQALISFNIIPNHESTHIISSWLSIHDKPASWVVEAQTGVKQLGHFINLIAFAESEDTCVNPGLWEELSDEKKVLALEMMRHDIFRGSLTEVPSIVELKEI